MLKMWTKIAVLFSVFLLINGNLLKPRFEYKYSFKGPHLCQADKSVPFWEYGGDAIASDESIRITPSLRSQKGWAWAKEVVMFDQWSVEIVFKVTGRGRIGADGLAVWFTEQKGVEGPVFGSNDKWKGLGVIFDSFDNDGQHNNPYIMAMVNDGTQEYDHNSDGSTQQLGGCLRDFRNKPYPIRAKIEYYNKILTVFVNTGLTNNKDEFELCMRQENVELPKNGYFGISAATGGLADDHDVLAFLAHSLHSEEQKVGSQVGEQDRQKYEKEFDEYYQQLEKAKQDYQQQHPGTQQPGYDTPGMFEAQGDRELRMIFDGQTDIHTTLKQLNRKLDELLGRQEMVLTKVSQISGGGQVQVPQGGTQQGGGQPLMVDTIKRHEVDRVLNNQNDIIQQARDIRSIVNDVQQRTNYIQSSVGQGGQGGGGGGGGGGNVPYNMDTIMNELQENLRYVKTDVNNLINRPQGSGNVQCPPSTPSSCVTPVIFFVAVIAQVVLIIGYMLFQKNKEAQAKKFY